MTVKEAFLLLEDYSDNTTEFNPGEMLLGIDQTELTRQVIDSGLIQGHLSIPGQEPSQLVIDAVVHGICIGALMKGEANG